jgi:hypothetical protein
MAMTGAKILRLAATIAVLAAIQCMFVSTPASAQQMSFRTGTWTGSAIVCARNAMAALSDAGFNQNLKFLDGQPPAQVATGARPDGFLAMVICAPKGDTVIIVSGPDTEPAITSLAQKLNEISRR